jgi:hypothetical protein
MSKIRNRVAFKGDSVFSFEIRAESYPNRRADVAVTRAIKRATILTPRNKVCRLLN